MDASQDVANEKHAHHTFLQAQTRTLALPAVFSGPFRSPCIILVLFAHGILHEGQAVEG